MCARFLIPGIMLANIFSVDFIERLAEPIAEEKIIKAIKIISKITKYLIVLARMILLKINL